MSYPDPDPEASLFGLGLTRSHTHTHTPAKFDPSCLCVSCVDPAVLCMGRSRGLLWLWSAFAALCVGRFRGLPVVRFTYLFLRHALLPLHVVRRLCCGALAHGTCTACVSCVDSDSVVLCVGRSRGLLWSAFAARAALYVGRFRGLLWSAFRTCYLFLRH